MAQDRETIATYDARASEYAEKTESDVRDKQLAAFIAALPNEAAVLDLGCGPGHLAGEMARHGLKVTAIDASAEMVKLAAAYDGVTARQASFDALDNVAAFDGIWANFSLLHATRDAMPRHLAAIHRALKPGGLFHIGLKCGTGEERDSIGRYYTYYEEPELLELLGTAGFTIQKINRGRGKGLAGTYSDWITVAAHA